MEYLHAGILKAVVAKHNNVDMDVVVHQLVDSTNSWSLQQCKHGRVLPFACFAEQQSQGRGRRGKQWLASARSNITMSVSWPFVLSGQQLQLLPMSIAMAIVDTLEDLGLKHVQVKWPNDVYVRGKKIAGILIETQPIKERHAVAAKATAVVIGVGLNYDMSSYASSSGWGEHRLLPGFTDIRREIKVQAVERQADRVMVASTLLQTLVNVCQGFQQEPKRLLEKFRAGYDFCKNKTLEITLDNNETASGVALGVNDAAELIVLIDGERRTFNSAEVSIKADSL